MSTRADERGGEQEESGEREGEGASSSVVSRRKIDSLTVPSLYSSVLSLRPDMLQFEGSSSLFFSLPRSFVGARTDLGLAPFVPHLPVLVRHLPRGTRHTRLGRYLRASLWMKRFSLLFSLFSFEDKSDGKELQTNASPFLSLAPLPSIPEARFRSSR